MLGIIEKHLNALALRDDHESALSALATLGMVGLHLCGLAAFWRYYHLPIWLALPTLLVALAFPLVRSRRAPAVETLAPLFFLYAVLIARVIAVRVLLANEPYADEASFADPRFIFFQVEAATAVAITYTALVQVVRLTRGKVRGNLLAAGAVLLMVAALPWFAVETIGHRTRGVTATDPYVYAQMAVDLATNGTPLHAFSLFPHIVNLNVSWYPIEHIGYRLFDNLTGAVPSVWPVGGSIWIAVLYRLIGEEGLYLATPLAALASLIAFAFFGYEYLGPRTNDSSISFAKRLAVAAAAVVLLATSWEQVDRSMVPLVDVQAQLFSVLAILFTLRGVSLLQGDQGRSVFHRLPPASRYVPFAVLAGLSLGAAYSIRHTQLLMVFPMVVAVAILASRNGLAFLAIAGLAALVVALPDLWYHQVYLGAWLTPESHELALFSATNVVPSIKALSDRFLAGNEFGYLVPFLLYGIYRAARQDARRFVVLAVWIVVLVGFHLMYAAVKIRDLLPEYPAVVFLTAYGVVQLPLDVRNWAGTVAPGADNSIAAAVRQGTVAIAIFFALLLPAMRDRMTIMRPFQPAKVTFGYVTAAQRASFDQIAALTPANAVIGSTMNDGPIELYAGRATFRPGEWNAQECERFIQVMAGSGRAIYLLDDGAQTSAARRQLVKGHTVRLVAAFDVPLFGEVDGTPGALWQVEP